MALNSVILLVVATFIVGCTLSQSEKIASQDGDNRHNQMKLLVSNNYIEMVTVYDPVWLAELWPKLRNGAHLSLNKFCWRNMTVFFQDLLDGRAWALGAVDSTGSFGSGLLWGNHFWIGSQEQCNDLDHRYQDLISNSSGRAIGHQKHISTLNRNGESTDSKDYHGGSSRESDLLARNSPPFRMAFSAVSVHLNITKASLLSSHQIVLGACLPLVCHPLDVRELLEFSVRSYEGLVGAALPRTTRVTGVRQLNQDYTVYDDPKFYIISSMILFILLLVIIGTVLEINADSYVLERDLELSRPSFKSFTKSEPAEFAIGLDKSSLYNNNVHCEYDNNNTKILQTPKILTQKSADPIHTIDGLIPNRYTEISGIFPIDDLSMDLNKHIGVRLLSTKNLNHTGIKSDVSTKCDNSYSAVTTLSDSRGKNNKYVLSTEDPSNFYKFVNRMRNFNVFNGGWIDKDNPLVRVLMCFSLKTNLGKIFSVDVGEDTLAPIHGMKVISLLWVIGVHTCLAVFELSDNKVYRGTIESNFFYQTISNATYSVDTFFVLSGLLVSYLYCQTIKKHSSVNLLSDGGFFMKALQYIGIMAHRYIRLTPPYMLVVGLAEVCSRGLRAHSPVLLGADHYNCAHFWWRNAFYVNTFYPLREMCMPWSWYLSNDTQFYFVGIFLLMVGVRHVRLAGLVAAVLLLAGWATTALVAVKTGYTPSVENPLSHYDDLYDKPWTRLGPYLIGLGAGWTLSKINCCLHISKAVSSCLWVVSVSTMLTIVYGLHGRELGMYGGAAYVTASHTAWGLAAAWVLVACVTGYGGFVNKLLSWRRFYPLSRLGYCTYLLHPLLLRTVLSSAGGVLHMSVETVVVNFVGFTVLSFMAALVVSLALEAPAVSLLRLFNPLRN